MRERLAVDLGGYEEYRSGARFDLIEQHPGAPARTQLLGGVRFPATWSARMTRTSSRCRRSSASTEWLTPTAYMMAKVRMSLCALAIAKELREDGITSDAL